MLALIAGQGGLPGALVAARQTQPYIAAMDGFPPDELTPDEVFRIEHLGSFLKGLTARGITQVAFAGAMARPPIDQSQIDADTMPLVPRLAMAMGQGDDALLREVLAVFEEAGLSVVGADQIAPHLLPGPGILGTQAPSTMAESDVKRAAEIVQKMGQADVGQACVVHRGQALAIEGLFGTDWMLNSLGARPDGKGGVFFKAPKPDQDRRVDLPTIGPETVRRAATAGLDGLALAAGGVLVLDQAATVAEADALGLFLWVKEL